MKNALKRLVAVSYVLALALMLGACGGGGSAAPTPITTPPVSTVAPAPFARVVMATPDSGAAITTGDLPHVKVEYGLTGGPYSDLWVYACLSEDGGVTYIPSSCGGGSAQEISGQKTVSVSGAPFGHTTTAIVPLVLAGRMSTGGSILVRGESKPHTWMW